MDKRKEALDELRGLAVYHKKRNEVLSANRITKIVKALEEPDYKTMCDKMAIVLKIDRLYLEKQQRILHVNSYSSNVDKIDVKKHLDINGEILTKYQYMKGE